MNAALILLVLAMNPFEKNDPDVEEGTEAYERGDFQTALKHYEEAKKRLGESAQIELNRGLAQHRLGFQDDAKKTLQHALEIDKGELAQQLHYNLGNVNASLGKDKEAIGEYRAALRLDPNDQAARHNLEVLLRKLPPKNNSSGADGGAPDGGKGDAGREDGGLDGGRPDGGVDAGRPDGGQGDGGQGDGGSRDAGMDGGQGDGGTDGGKGDQGNDGDGGRGNSDAGSKDGGGPGEKDDAGMGSGGDKSDGGTDGGAEEQDGGTETVGAPDDTLDGGSSLSRGDAEKLLDSLKQTEKNHPLWRFQQKTKKDRTGNAKDW